MRRDFGEPIETVHSGVPGEMCRETLRTLAARLDAPIAWFFQVAEADGKLWYTNFECAGSRLSERIWENVGEHPRFNSVWHPGRPRDEEVNRFVDVGRLYGREVLDNTEVYDEVYLEYGLSDALRALLYDGGRFIGWIGLMREGRGTAFTSDEIEALNAAQKTIRAVVTALDAMRAHQVGDPSLFAKFRPDGELTFASCSARRWLTAERIDCVGTWVRRFDRRDGTPVVRTLDGAELRLVRLDGEEGVRYLLTIDRMTLPNLDRFRQLTNRQQEVAEYAAAGATNAEIARTLDVSKSTVKYHLKRVYDSLEIDGRVDLAGVV